MLTEKQQKFVEAYIANGGQNGTDACRQAGYAGNSHVMWQTAYELLRKPHILAAIKLECRRMDEEGLPFARMQLQKILMNERHEKHFDALKWYFGVLGISPVSKSESKKTVEHTTNLGALEELKLLAAQLRGLPAPKMIDATPIEEDEWSAHD